MPALTLIAEFPLGVFQGRKADGATRDPYPDTARLHAALLDSASKGSLAVAKDGDLRPSDESLRALRWVEEHPPTALAIPTHVEAHPRQELVSFRNEGILNQNRLRVARASLRCRTALASPVGWLWDDVPLDVKQRLEDLCQDVSYLGEADSPVVLSSGTMEPTHYWDPNATAFSARGLVAERSPGRGRVDALEAEYERLYPRRMAASKAATKNETSLSARDVGHLRTVHYAPRVKAEPATPWTSVWVFEASQGIPEELRVRMCVAFHRALAARLGDDAPPIITGSFPAGFPRPANRVALQVLDAAHGRHLGLSQDAFLLLIPRGMDAADLARLEIATMGTLQIRTRELPVRCHRTQAVAADEFWPASADDCVRVFRPAPALVSETRRQPRYAGREWTLAEAALLSLAFVFRDDLGEVDGPRYWGAVDAVVEAGARVSDVTRVHDSRVERYAYKYPASMVAQPYVTYLRLGELAGDRSLLALGQSRHLGGGLLIPYDVPADQLPKGLR